MRVLHLGKYYPPFAGGMENFMADLLPALHAQGVTAAALVHDEQPRRGGLRPAPGDVLPIYRAPCYGRLLYAPVSPAFPFWLARAIREFQPDLLHLHLPNTSAFWALAIPAARRLPWVIHWHADVVATPLDRGLGRAYRLYRPLEQRLLAASQAVIVTSPPYLDASAALAPWRERCHVIPLGLDPSRVADPEPAAFARAEALWGDADFRVLAIGRLTYYKGHDALIRAAAELEPCRALIVGTGERRQRLETLIQSLGLAGCVRLPGFQPDADLNALLAGCDVLCLPSLDRAEAFGVVLLEAMRFGKPVIVSDIPGSGTGWVVRQAGHGLLVPPDDPAQLAAALRELHRNPARRQSLGAAGATALRERFGIGPVAAAVAGLYRQSLNQA
ncbi:MAG: glycosyltransferase [Candidatus Competibacter sp.]|nr:glycosyltransferase [Candidatus Competibacter sp.]MDG4605482.1 glycosyltransferase [Candidatus Contendobacter sp.]HRD49648.1 glycosyltransferase [Candidatus Contendobacter sp.]